MKTILSLTLLCLVASCDLEKYSEYTFTNYLVGKWEITEKGQLDGHIVDFESVNTSFCDPDNLIFAMNLHFTFVQFDHFGEDCISTSREGIYSIYDKSFTLSGDSEDELIPSTTYTVISLTYNFLEVSFTDQNGNLVFLKLNKVIEN
jgi:hypothetical protein